LKQIAADRVFANIGEVAMRRSELSAECRANNAGRKHANFAA
jgi:hypothetical protein